MTHGPVDGLLAFWSGMQASIWIGNFPGDTFSEHRTWYILEKRKKGKKFLFRITDQEDRRMANFTMMMRFLTFFFMFIASLLLLFWGNCLGLPRNNSLYLLCSDEFWGTFSIFLFFFQTWKCVCFISFMRYYIAHSVARLQIELKVRKSAPSVLIQLWVEQKRKTFPWHVCVCSEGKYFHFTNIMLHQKRALLPFILCRINSFHSE